MGESGSNAAIGQLPLIVTHGQSSRRPLATLARRRHTDLNPAKRRSGSVGLGGLAADPSENDITRQLLQRGQPRRSLPTDCWRRSFSCGESIARSDRGKTMPSSILLFAAKHQESPEVALITAILGIIACVIAVIAALNKNQNAVWKNGVAYCPRCGKQISLKTSRSHCRACGYNLVQSPSAPVSPPATMQQTKTAQESRSRLLQAARKAAEQEQLRQHGEDRRRRHEEAVARRAEREQAYRAKGVEPGPWAWFQVLPDLAQAALMGLAIAIPAALILIVAFRVLFRPGEP